MKSSKKICLIAPNFMEPHAWMASAYKTALLLKKIGYEVVVITSQTKDSLQKEIIEGITVHRVPCFFIGDPFNSAIPLSFPFHVHRIIKSEKPDSFIVNKYMFFTSLSVFQLRLYGKKVIMQTDTFPGINWFAPSRLLNVIMWVYARTIGIAILRLSNTVILLHEGLISVAQKLKLKYIVIHNGVDFTQFKNAHSAKDVVTLKKKKTLITYIGRLDEVKGYKTLLNVIDTIDTTQFHFLFVCGDKDAEKRKKLAKKYAEKATFYGFRNDIAQVLKASDIYVMPSFMEGLPNTLMEAMAAGLPCIATNVGGIPVLMRGNEGILIPRNNSKAMHDAILKIKSNKKLAQSLGKNAQRRIEKEFSFTAITKKWKELLSSQ